MTGLDPPNSVTEFNDNGLLPRKKRGTLPNPLNKGNIITKSLSDKDIKSRHKTHRKIHFHIYIWLKWICA